MTVSEERSSTLDEQVSLVSTTAGVATERGSWSAIG